MAKPKKKWIQSAIKREGRITALCRLKGYRSVTKECLEKLKATAKRTKDRSLMSAVNLAYRFKYGDLSKRRAKS